MPSPHGDDYDVREISFHPATRVREALENIRDQWHLPEDSDRKQFGLFMMSENVSQEEKYEKVSRNGQKS